MLVEEEDLWDEDAADVPTSGDVTRDDVLGNHSLEEGRRVIRRKRTRKMRM